MEKTQYVLHTRNSCWTAIHRTNPENCLWLTNYRQSLLYRDWNNVKVTLQRKRKTSLQSVYFIGSILKKNKIFFFKICVKSNSISEKIQQIKKEKLIYRKQTQLTLVFLQVCFKWHKELLIWYIESIRQLLLLKWKHRWITQYYK